MNKQPGSGINPCELLQRAKEMAAREVLHRGLKGLRAEVMTSALVDHYHHKLVAEAQAQQVAA